MQGTFIILFVFGDDVHYCSIQHFLRLFSFLSNVLVSFSMELLIRYLNKIQLEIRGWDEIGKSAYAMWGRNKRKCATMGEGVNFLPFGCVRTN